MTENVFNLFFYSIVSLPNNFWGPHFHSKFWRIALLFSNFWSYFREIHVIFLPNTLLLDFLSYNHLSLGFSNFTKICFGLGLFPHFAWLAFSSVQDSYNLSFLLIISSSLFFFCPIWVEVQLVGHWTCCIDFLVFLPFRFHCPWLLFLSYILGVIVFFIYKHFLICCSFSKSILFFSH